MTRRERRDWDRLQDRWAAGEPLTAEEEARRLARAAADPVARREMDALASMAGLLEEAQPDAAHDALIEAVLERAGVPVRHKVLYLPRRGTKAAGPGVRENPPPASRRTRGRAALGGFVAAMAAMSAVYAVRSFERGRRETKAAAPLAGVPQAEATLASAAGEVQLAPASGSEPAPPSPGRSLRAGDRVRTGNGTACLRVEPAIKVCLGPNSDVQIGSLRPPETQILVARGVAVAALAPRAAGRSFALVGGDVVAVAHGTVYALDRTSAVSVGVVVLEGTVAVHAPGQAGAPDMVPAHTRWRGQPSTRATVTPEEEESLAALLAPAAPEQTTPARAEAPRPLHRSADSPDLFLARARAALDRGDRRAALAWYGRLRGRFPNDESARTVLVTSGRLEMDLGAPSRALDDFQSYLRGGGGALEMEALAGTARALRTLGRIDEERRAIERYLVRFPNGFDAPVLRTRRAELERPLRVDGADSRR
jgi:hypothetical protein